METTQTTGLYKVLLLFTVLAALGGLLTLMPWPGASYPNVLGYSSLCTFAPGASLYCFAIAGFICFLRSTFVKDKDGTAAERFSRHIRSLVPIVFLLILALATTVWFVQVKSLYTDTATQASAVIEE